jgi:hypothetical protein
MAEVSNRSGMPVILYCGDGQIKPGKSIKRIKAFSSEFKGSGVS